MACLRVSKFLCFFKSPQFHQSFSFFQSVSSKIIFPLRVWIFSVCAVLCAGLFVVWLVWCPNIRGVVLSFSLLYVMLMFVMLDLHRFELKSVWFVLLCIGLLVQLFLFDVSWQISGAWWVALMGVVILMRRMKEFFQNERKMRWFAYFSQS